MDVKRSAEFGAEIKRRFKKSIAETDGVGDEIELILDNPTTIDHIITMEDIKFGERVRKYVLEGYVNDNWVELCHGSAIGHKKIDRIEPVQASKVRFRCLESVEKPLVRKLAVYNIQ
jgi:alpha-L-fucosidase